MNTYTTEQAEDVASKIMAIMEDKKVPYHEAYNIYLKRLQEQHDGGAGAMRHMPYGG